MSERELNLAKLHARLRDLHFEIASVHDEYLRSLAPQKVDATLEGVPLTYKNETVGKVLIGANEVKLVPEKAYTGHVDSSPLRWLDFGALTNLRNKGFQVTLNRDENGILKSIQVSGAQISEHIDSLKRAASWSFYALGHPR